MSWALVYFFPLAGPLLGLLSGSVAILARATLGYDRTAGYLRFILSSLPVRTAPEPGTTRLVLAELAFFACLGFAFLVSVIAVGITAGFPPFYGALSYSSAAVRALTIFCLAFGLGAGLVLLFFTEPDDRADYLGLESILGLFVGTLVFGVAARSALLLFMYPDTHRELWSRAGTDLPYGRVLDVLPFLALFAVVTIVFLVASLVRWFDTSFRPWHALCSLAVVGYVAPMVVLWLSVAGPLGTL